MQKPTGRNFFFGTDQILATFLSFCKFDFSEWPSFLGVDLPDEVSMATIMNYERSHVTKLQIIHTTT